MNKLAIVTSHPIQYYAPLFRMLSKHINLKVFYCHQPSSKEIGQDGFGKAFEWDIDLISGYSYEFLENRSRNPSLSNFNGCNTPQIGGKIKAYGATHVVIFGWYLKSFIQTLGYCNKNKIPVAVRGDSQLDPNLIWWKKLIKNIYYPFFLKRYDAFLYVGQRNKEYLLHYNVPTNKLIFSPHAVDQEFWINKKGKRNPEKFIFVWIGKMIDKKRPFDVIEAFQKAFKSNEKLELWMVGSGELLHKLKLKSKNILNIKFLGFKNQTELLEILNKSNSLVLSSDYRETWGLVVNEAMSCGLPAIVSSACGCSVDLIDEHTGYVYNMGNIPELEHNLKLMSKRNIESFQAGLRLKNDLFSYKSNVNAFLSFLNNAV